MDKPFQIAIDGPVAAGKGTVAIKIAKKLDFLYVDTGAMYRVAAWLALKEGVSFENEKDVVELVKRHKIEMRMPQGKEKDGRLTTILLDGKDVSWDIRTEEISTGASKVAVLKSLRAELVRQQQEIANGDDVVMEGRDIGIRVLPEAELKIYMDADLNTRVQRRFKQLKDKGTPWSFKAVKQHIQDRDNRERTRDIDPMRPAPGAWILDNTSLTIDKTVDKIIEEVARLKAEKKLKKKAL
jgi:CMP/dCMP kinase